MRSCLADKFILQNVFCGLIWNNQTEKMIEIKRRALKGPIVQGRLALERTSVQKRTHMSVTLLND